MFIPLPHQKLGRTICSMRLCACHHLSQLFQSFENSLSYFCTFNCMHELLWGIFSDFVSTHIFEPIPISVFCGFPITTFPYELQEEL